MASNIRSFSFNTALCFTILTLFQYSNGVAAVPEQEIELMLAVLRRRGYSLFSNAVDTTDIYYEIVAGTSFTFFVPTDSSLFTLDMTATASDYVATLRRHVVPSRLSVSDLRSLQFRSTLKTLDPNQDIHVQRRPGSAIITVDGVDVVVPGLFYGQYIAVHGLGGILSFRPQSDQIHGSPPPQLEDLHASDPYRTPVVERSHDPPENSPGNRGSPMMSHLPGPAPSANLSDHITPETPESEGNGDRALVSPLLESTSPHQFSPAVSPGMASSTGPALAPSWTEPQSAQKVDNLNPDPYSGKTTWMASSPMEEMATDITAGSPATEISWPFGPETLDCSAEESEALLDHVSILAGNPVTLQRTNPTPTCKRK